MSRWCSSIKPRKESRAPSPEDDRWLHYKPPACLSVASQLPPGDYICPELTVTLPDTCFPKLIAGDKAANSGRTFGGRFPIAGSPMCAHRQLASLTGMKRPSRNNTALRFRGRNALEIGCIMIWSAVRLALGGIHLDVVDPLLEEEAVRTSVIESLRAANVPGRVTLYSSMSPIALQVPNNITLTSLPPRSPELNPTENIWRYMRQNWLSNRVFQTYDDILAPSADAWNKLTHRPWTIMSIATRDWVTIGHHH